MRTGCGLREDTHGVFERTGAWPLLALKPAANDSSLTHDSAEVEEGKGYRDDDGYYKGGHGGYDDDDTGAVVNDITPTEDAGAAAVLQKQMHTNKLKTTTDRVILLPTYGKKQKTTRNCVKPRETPTPERKEHSKKPGRKLQSKLVNNQMVPNSLKTNLKVTKFQYLHV
ncbi:hypothetical protein Tco_0991496 [Tanacetum coccineum]|uniref:Uncharacterized protein n=1 Tax=Tanacetum coccineum TaxID=301880 RepID=A0ABQ5F157_9ASTR